MKQCVLVWSILMITVGAMADVNVYTDRSRAFLDPIVEAFEKEYGERVNFINGSYEDMKNRLISEGEQTPADMVIFKDLVYMNELKDLGLLKALPEQVNSEMVAGSLKGENWVSISMRPRTIVYSTERTEGDLSDISYEDLADEKWRGRLCVRTSSSSYNKGLGAAMVNDLGALKTKEILSGWVKNFAEAPLASDGQILGKIANNEGCDIGVVNSYYLARAIDQNPDVELPLAIALNNKPYVNGVAAGVLSTAEPKEGIANFINFMLNSEVQNYISNANKQFSTTDLALSNEAALAWGDFSYNQSPWATTENIETAEEIFEAVSYK